MTYVATPFYLNPNDPYNKCILYDYAGNPITSTNPIPVNQSPSTVPTTVTGTFNGNGQTIAMTGLQTTGKVGTLSILIEAAAFNCLVGFDVRQTASSTWVATSGWSENDSSRFIVSKQFSTVTNNYLFLVSVVGFDEFRLTSAAYGGGTGAVTIRAHQDSGFIHAMIPDYQTINLARVGGNSVVTGTGALEGNGVQVVTIAADCAGQIKARGAAAHGSSVSGNPLLVGLEARTSNPTAVSNGQAVRAQADKLGRQVTIQNAVRDLCDDQRTVITSTTSATTIVSAESSIFRDLVSLLLTNISGTGTEVELLNDDGTTVRATFYVPANDMRGVVWQTPLNQTTVNHTWKLKTVTSIASLKVAAQFVKNV